MSAEKQRDYESLKEKVELRFRQVYLKHVHQMQFKHHNQKPKEFEAEITRLVQSSNPEAPDNISLLMTSTESNLYDCPDAKL